METQKFYVCEKEECIFRTEWIFVKERGFLALNKNSTWEEKKVVTDSHQAVMRCLACVHFRGIDNFIEGRFI